MLTNKISFAIICKRHRTDGGNDGGIAQLARAFGSYPTGRWFKRLLLRIEFVFRDTRGESHIPQIPDHIRKEIARCLLPDIVAYFESEKGQREFEEWKKAQGVQNQTTTADKESEHKNSSTA